MFVVFEVNAWKISFETDSQKLGTLLKFDDWTDHQVLKKPFTQGDFFSVDLGNLGLSLHWDHNFPHPMWIKHWIKLENRPQTMVDIPQQQHGYEKNPCTTTLPLLPPVAYTSINGVLLSAPSVLSGFKRATNFLQPLNPHSISVFIRVGVYCAIIQLHHDLRVTFIVFFFKKRPEILQCSQFKIQ